MGIALGLGFGIMEIFILSKYNGHFQKMPILKTIFIKAILYSSVIFVISNLLSLVYGLSMGRTMDEFYENMVSRDQAILTFYTLVLFILLNFNLQINLLLGDGVLRNFLLGRYRKPTGENRIFMFLDLKSSTTIAEKLGHEKYYAFLNDFFHEITEPVRDTDAEIYQYIGDEVVFTWKTEQGLSNNNCLKIFYQIQEKVNQNLSYYRNKYEAVPQFKAGLHYGEVISAQIGDIKKEIVYNGDVMNTSARIQEQCNKFNRELLISGSLLQKLDIRNHYASEKLDTIKLRGKELPVDLYSVAES